MRTPGHNLKCIIVLGSIVLACWGNEIFRQPGWRPAERGGGRQLQPLIMVVRNKQSLDFQKQSARAMTDEEGRRGGLCT
jgi:hypothetical protein